MFILHVGYGGINICSRGKSDITSFVEHAIKRHRGWYERSCREGVAEHYRSRLGRVVIDDDRACCWSGIVTRESHRVENTGA